MTTLSNFKAKRISSFGETVFATYSRLAKELGAVNLGQGFPDFDPPQFALDALVNAAKGYQQYAPLYGMPELLEAVSTKMSGRLGRQLEPTENVLITVGATEALYASIQAIVDPGDEVILFEPFYDAYPADTIMAGGVPRYVPLHPQADGTWQLDFDELEQVFNNKTKAIIINNPQNPTGKVFSVEELDKIVALATTYNAIIISDEVYEHLVYEQTAYEQTAYEQTAYEPHTSIATRPGAWERTITISSVGKTFSVTGWKIGWAIAPKKIIDALCMAHQWIPFVVASPLQKASAQMLVEAENNSYYSELVTMYQAKRDLLFNALEQTPLKPLKPQGAYYIIADSSELDYENDVALCLDFPKRVGVVGIPPSAFYSAEHKHLAKNLVRFTFCKTDESLNNAAQRLKENL